jgi:nicotinamidase-related amidase
MKTELCTYIANRDRTVLPSNPGFERWLDPDKTAVVCIDMHRGHVGPEDQVTVPAPRARAKIPHHDVFHAACREIGIPIIFAQGWYRPGGFETADPENAEATWAPFLLYPLYLPANPLMDEHSREGTKWLDLMVEHDPRRDHYVRTKKRYSAFYPTDLEFLLRRLGVENIVITGTFTDCCDTATAFDACNRDFRVIIPRDVVAGYSEELENAALMIISLHVGLVTDAPALLAEWYARKGRTLPDSLQGIDDIGEASLPSRDGDAQVPGSLKVTEANGITDDHVHYGAQKAAS